MKLRALGLLLLFGGLLSAAPISVKLVDTGTPTVKDSSGYSVGPYDLLFQGQSIQALCVDPLHTSSIGSSWNVNVTALSSVKSGDQTYLHDQALYAGAAYLYNLLLQGNTDRKNIQDAVWVLMDPSFKNDLNSADKNSTFYSYLNAAQNPTNYTPFESLSDFYILSDTSSRNKNQEFLVYIPSQNSATPEPGTLAMFGIFFILAGAGIRFAKKRNATA